MVRFSRELWGYDGAITLDVPIQTYGTIAESFLEQLKADGAALSDQ